MIAQLLVFVSFWNAAILLVSHVGSMQQGPQVPFSCDPLLMSAQTAFSRLRYRVVSISGMRNSIGQSCR